MTRRGPAAVVCIALATLAGGCVPGKGGGPLENAPSEAASGAQGRCRAASPALVRALERRLAAGEKIADVWLVRSRDYEQAFFVSARVDDDRTATWVTVSPRGGRLIFAVTDTARKISDFDDGGGRFSGSDDGVAESQRCAEGVEGSGSQ